MSHLRLLLLALLVSGCGGSKTAGSLSVVCASGTQLFGASSIDVLGDLADGRPTMEFPDPANRDRTDTISIKPHDHCKITPG
jgi:hypothetical protein